MKQTAIAGAPQGVVLDHVIIAVLDRDLAGNDFEALGFSTIEGGAHPGAGTHNRLIPLAQGPYLELVSPTDLRRLSVRYPDDNTQWLFVFNAGEGYVGYALEVPDLEAVARRLEAVGYPLNGPHLDGRELPDGRLVQAEGLSVEGRRYPAAVRDVTPRSWRRPPLSGLDGAHKNGAIGVSRIICTVHNLDEAAVRYQAITGMRPSNARRSPAARLLDFIISDTTLTIGEPVDRDSAMFEDLQIRGEAPFLVELRTNDSSPAGRMDLTLAHHARIELI